MGFRSTRVNPYYSFGPTAPSLAGSDPDFQQEADWGALDNYEFDYGQFEPEPEAPSGTKLSDEDYWSLMNSMGVYKNDDGLLVKSEDSDFDLDWFYQNAIEDGTATESDYASVLNWMENPNNTATTEQVAANADPVDMWPYITGDQGQAPAANSQIATGELQGSPVVQDDDGLLTLDGYMEANPGLFVSQNYDARMNSFNNAMGQHQDSIATQTPLINTWNQQMNQWDELQQQRQNDPNQHLQSFGEVYQYDPNAGNYTSINTGNVINQPMAANQPQGIMGLPDIDTFMEGVTTPWDTAAADAEAARIEKERRDQYERDQGYDQVGNDDGWNGSDTDSSNNNDNDNGPSTEVA